MRFHPAEARLRGILARSAGLLQPPISLCFRFGLPPAPPAAHPSVIGASGIPTMPTVIIDAAITSRGAISISARAAIVTAAIVRVTWRPK